MRDVLLKVFFAFAAIVIGFSFGHEFGYIEGQQYQKIANAQKLESCNRIIVGNLYEH